MPIASMEGQVRCNDRLILHMLSAYTSYPQPRIKSDRGLFQGSDTQTVAASLMLVTKHLRHQVA